MSAVIVPFEPKHLVALQGRAFEEKAFVALGGVERVAAMCDTGDYAYSVLADDTPVACIGVTKCWAGVGSAWAFLSPQSCRCWLTIHRGVLMFLRGALADEFHRIDTSVRLDHATGHRWAQRLGFKPESVRHQYGPDRADYMVYARFAL